MSWTEWYNQNKKSYNARRRKRYHTDPEYREVVKGRARERRERMRADGTSTYVPSENKGRFFRQIGDKRVEVFKTSAVASAIGKTNQVLRRWEATGLIPQSCWEGKHRVYTKHQMDLISELSDLLSYYYKNDRVALRSKKSEWTKAIYSKWRDEWATP